MAEYLLPEAQLNETEKHALFATRAEINLNPYNFGRQIHCEKGCLEDQTKYHI